jgi:hypothetical protein
MSKTWKPVIAAILLIGASVPYFVSSIRWFITPGFISEEAGGGQIWPWVGVVILVPFLSPLLIGAICAFFRKACGLAFIGALTPIVLTIFLRPWGWEDMGMGYLLRSSSVYVYGPLMALNYIFMGAAAVLLFLSRREFGDRETSSERLYSPPKNWRDKFS